MQTLVCEKRGIKNKGYVKGLRRKGWVPGIINGQATGSVPILVFEKQIVKILNTHGHRGLFALHLAEESRPIMVLIRDMQKHPLTGRLVHVDLLAVNLDEKINSGVAIVITGDDEIAKNGTVLQPGIKEVVVNCLPQEIPEHLICDVSRLEIGEKKTVGDLKVPDGVEVLSDPDTVVVSVVAPTVLEAEEPAEEEHGEAEGTEG